MANPRYQRQRNPQEERLAQLAALAQIYSGLQAPQMRAQENQQQNALGVLGLILSQQGRQDALKQDQRQFETTQTNQAGRSEEVMKTKALEILMNDPSLSPQEKQAAVMKLSPNVAPAYEAIGQVRQQAAVDKRTPDFQAAYQTHANNPRELKKSLDTLKLDTATTPGVFENQPWDTLNQGLPAPQPAGPGFLDRVFGGGAPSVASTQPATTVAAQPYSFFESPDVALARRQQEQQTGVRLTPEELARQKKAATDRITQRILQQAGITQ